MFRTEKEMLMSLDEFIYKSKGAFLEKNIAEFIGLQVLYEIDSSSLID